MSVATLAEIYVAAALRVKTSLPRALHFLTVSGVVGRQGGQGWGLISAAPTSGYLGKGLHRTWHWVMGWAPGLTGVSAQGPL